MSASKTTMWLRRIGVAALLAAPVAVVLVVAWPPAVPAQEVPGTDVDGGVLAVGDDLDGQVAFGGRVSYQLTGTGEVVTIGVEGNALDPMLAVLDQDGRTLAENDDREGGGTDSEVVLLVEDGQTVVVVVRGFSGAGGRFTIRAEAGGELGGSEEVIDGGELAIGGALDGDLGRDDVAVYTLVGTGDAVTIGVEAGDDGLDHTLTILEGDGGDQLVFNDDAHGLDPEVTLTLDEGEVVRIEVRELAGRTGGFTVYADEGTVGRRGPIGAIDGGRPGPGVVVTPVPLPAPETTIPVEG